MLNTMVLLSKFTGQIADFFKMTNLKITFVDFIEILIISFLFYHVLRWVKSTRAWTLFKGILVIIIFVLLAALFQMSTILWIAKNTLDVGLIAIVIIFQPELRKALENLGGKNILSNLFNFSKTEAKKFSDRTIEEYVRDIWHLEKVTMK